MKKIEMVLQTTSGPFFGGVCTIKYFFTEGAKEKGPSDLRSQDLSRWGGTFLE